MGTLTEETAWNGIITNLTYDPHVERLTGIIAGSGGMVPLNRLVAATIAGGTSKTYAYDATGSLIYFIAASYSRLPRLGAATKSPSA